MSQVVALKGAVDSSTFYVVPGVALVMPSQQQARDPKGAPTGPPQTIIGESVVQFFGNPMALRIKGSPLDVAKNIAGLPELV